MHLHPYIRGVFPGLSENNNDDDVTVVKGLLGLLGYGRRSKAGPSCFAGTEFFDDVREFQQDKGLKPDGVITPTGETARTIDKLLSEKTGDDSWGTSDLEKRCAHNLKNVDGPVCRRLDKIRRKQGKRRVGAGSNCWASANARYAACLRGTPLDDLPPLNTWNN